MKIITLVSIFLILGCSSDSPEVKRYQENWKDQFIQGCVSGAVIADEMSEYFDYCICMSDYMIDNLSPEELLDLDEIQSATNKGVDNCGDKAKLKVDEDIKEPMDAKDILIKDGIYSEIELSGAKIKMVNTVTGQDTARGKKSPVITVKSLNSEIKTSYPPSAPTIILFVAHWCPYCQKQIKDIIKWTEEDGVFGVNILLIVTHSNPSKENYPPDKWLQNEKWGYTVIYDDVDNSIAEYFGVEGFPAWVFTDGMTIAMTHKGSIAMDELKPILLPEIY